MNQDYEFANADMLIFGQQFSVRYDAIFVRSDSVSTLAVKQYGFDLSRLPTVLRFNRQFIRLWVDLRELQLSLAFFDWEAAT